jgi:hypothetical protein
MKTLNRTVLSEVLKVELTVRQNSASVDTTGTRHEAAAQFVIKMNNDSFTSKRQKLGFTYIEFHNIMETNSDRR